MCICPNSVALFPLYGATRHSLAGQAGVPVLPAASVSLLGQQEPFNFLSAVLSLENSFFWIK
jgi:hypothetical protein